MFRYKNLLSATLVLSLAACGGGGGGGGGPVNHSSSSSSSSSSSAVSSATNSSSSTSSQESSSSVSSASSSTAGPVNFEQLNTDAQNPKKFVVAGDKAFFVAETAEHGAELWVTDGSFSGTFMVKDIRPGDGSSSIGVMTAFGDKLIFSASDLTAFEGLWISDGTETGTYLLRDISTTSENIRFVHADADRVYFTSNHQDYGRELWVTDGTAEGTYMIADINPHGDSTVENAHRALVWEDKLYFWAWYYEQGTFTAYPQLYVTDGTEGNLVALTESDQSGSVLLDYDMIVYKDRLYFTWHSWENGREMWSSDGTREGTALALEINPEVFEGNGYDGWPRQFQIINDTLLFFAFEQGQHTYMSLWSTDGTQENTQVLGQVEADLFLENMIPLDNRLLFPGRANGAGSDYGLWATDGTAEGTVLVHDGVKPDFGDYVSLNIGVVFGDRVLFQGEDEEHGTEPWITDGTTEGTFMLKDLNPGTADSPANTVGAGRFAVRGDRAYFVAAVANEDYQLIETDGTTAGTEVVTPDFATVTNSPLGQPGFLNVIGLPAPYLVGDILVFPAAFTHEGIRLYRK